MTAGPVTCRVRLDRGGYVPGETIGVWANVNNQSKVTIKKTAACLSEVGLSGSGAPRGAIPVQISVGVVLQFA